MGILWVLGFDLRFNGMSMRFVWECGSFYYGFYMECLTKNNRDLMGCNEI